MFIEMKTKVLGFAQATQIKLGDRVVVGGVLWRVNAVLNDASVGMQLQINGGSMDTPLFLLDGLSGWVSWRDCFVYAGRSVKELAQEVLDIQNGCNPLGLSKGYARALQELMWALEVEGKKNDTDAIRCHAINRLWLDKLCDLARYNRMGGSDNTMEFIAAHDEVSRLAGVVTVEHLTEEQMKDRTDGMTGEQKQRMVYGFSGSEHDMGGE